MFNFNIINPPKSFILKESIIKEIFMLIENTEKKEHSGGINIVFVTNEKIKELNNQYRKKDSETDVLSFHYFDDFSELDKDEVAGEIIVSESKVISQAKQYKLGSELECYKLIIHSVFHILGYDHEDEQDYKVMQQKEDEIWNIIFSS